MSMSDNIADGLTRIRNAQQAKLLKVELINSKLILGVLSVMKEEGYIKDFVQVDNGAKSALMIDLKYCPDGTPGISEIARVSRPGKRIYSKIRDLRPCYNSMGIYILSTPSGIISDRIAHKMKVGGEIVCKIF